MPKIIAIFAPSHGFPLSSEDLAALETKKSIITNAGFDVDWPDNLISPPIADAPWANTKEERARRIINILNNAEIVAMWATGGGESAIDVVNLLNEYDKNPEKIKKQIADSYQEIHGKAPPADLFLPQISEFDYSRGALPKRGIYCIGMSDVSGINNFLGQRGIVSPLYADNFFSEPKSNAKILEYIKAGERAESKYENLTLLGGEFSSETPLPIYATIDGWIASSCGTDFQFALKESSILAIESIEDGNLTGLTLQQAYEAGALENVKAIVIGEINRNQQIGQDLEKYPALKEFVENSRIAVFTTNGDLATGKNTFGHGNGWITEPFANFASSTLNKQEDGAYSLVISGNRSLENLNDYYQWRQSIPRKDKVFFSNHYPQNTSDISINHEDLTEVNGSLAELSGSEFIHTNYRGLRFTNGTARQLDLRDKVLIVSDDNGLETNSMHQSLVENHLSRSTSDCPKAIIIAMPSPQNIDQALITLISPFLRYEQNDQDTYLSKDIPEKFFNENLKPSLDSTKNLGALSYDVEWQESGIFANVTIKIEDENKLKQAAAQKEEKEKSYEKRINAAKNMFKDAAISYFPDIPVYLVFDDKLVKNVSAGIQTGQLQLTTERHEPSFVEKLGLKPNEGSFVERQENRSKTKDSGSHEL